MLLYAPAFLAGITLFQRQTDLPGEYAIWLALLLLTAFSRRRSMRAVAVAVSGFLWAWWQAASLLQIQLPSGLAGADLVVDGVVEAMPERLPAGQLRFRFRIDQYQHGGQWHMLDLPARISWYRDAPRMVAGERWQLMVRLKPPHGFANPGGFDYERWLFAQRIRVTGYVRQHQGNRRIRKEHSHYVQYFRQILGETLRSRAGQGNEQALIYALALGDRSAMSAEQWQLLRRTGTSHLLAISGLHVGLISGLVFFLARRAWSRWGLPERRPAPVVAAFLATAAALAYAGLAGFQVPVQRALIMASVWMLALLWPTRPNSWSVWALALWLVLLRDPLAVLTAGLWLSFGAVACILFLTAGRYGQQSRLRPVLVVQPGIILGLIPLSWFWFQEVSLVAPLANLIAIPWIGFLVMPVLLITMLLLPVPILSDGLLALLGSLLRMLWWCLERLGASPQSVWNLPGIDSVTLIAVFAAIACLLAPRQLPLRPVGMLLLLAALFAPASRPQDGQFYFTLLDVGQGLAAVVETRRHVVVYDTGPAWPGGLDSGEAVVAPYLRYLGHQHIDYMIISHADNDHRGGAGFLLRQFRVGQVYSGEPDEIAWQGDVHQCSAGQHWTLDQVSFRFLSPLEAGEGNNASCVLRIETADGFVVLLPGDIEHRVETQLLAAGRQRLRADVLVAPHHGSRTSSTGAFIAAVRPDLVLFPVGYRNRFGFPKADVVQRYRDSAAAVLDTATSGAIRIRTSAEGRREPQRYREAHRRYWNSSAEGFVSR